MARTHPPQAGTHFPSTPATLNGHSSSAARVLPYAVSSHLRNWTIWFTCFLLDGTVIPITLFYSLWYHTTLSHWTIFALITSLSFWTSYHKWFSRGWRLLKKSPSYRPLGVRSRRPLGLGGMDTSWWVLSVALGVVVVELVAATSTKKVKIGVIAMAPPSVLYVLAVFVLGQNTAHVLGWRTWVRISSVAGRGGERVPPPLFTVMEDVFAVDGCHEGRGAREVMCKVYEGSAVFRRTLVLWSWVWGLACLVVAVGMSIVVALAEQTTCFGVTYGVCFPFIVVLSVVTAWWMERLDSKGAFSVAAVAGGVGKVERGMEMQSGRTRPR